MSPSLRIPAARRLRGCFAGVALGFLICPTPAAGALRGVDKANDSSSPKNPALVLAQNAVPVSKPSAAEKALLNDFSYREPEQELLLNREGERIADALSHYSRALAWEEMAEGEKALEEYLKVLELDPGFTELAIRVAYEFVRRGDIPRGLDILKDAAKATPEEPLIYLNIASIYARDLKKNDLAIRYARETLKVDGENPLVYQTLYEIYVAAGQLTNAERTLDQASKLKSKDPDFWLRLGDLYARVVLKDDGASTPEQLAKVNEIFKKVLEHSSDDVSILNRVADYYAYSRQVKDAIPLYVRILELRQDASAPLVSNVREKLARSFLLSGQREEAIGVLEEMLRSNPLKYETYELLGQLHEENGNLEKALANYEQSLLLSPSQPANHLRVSDMHLRLRHFDKAITSLEEARKHFPDIPLITYSLAVSYSQAKQHEKALQAFETTLREASHQEEEVLNGLFYFNYGAAAEQAGQYEKAAALFRKSIELDPSNAAPALNYLGYMWVDRGERLEEAEKMILQALEFEPNNGAYIDSLGWLYYKQGKYESALRELLRAVEHLETEDPVVYDHIGDTYHKLKNSKQALEYWKKAQILDPENKDIESKINASGEESVSSTP